MKIRIIDGQTVHRLLGLDACQEAVADAMRLTSQGKARQPLRSKLDIPGHDSALMGLMPGWIAEPRCFGLKAMSVFPATGSAQPSHKGAILLFDGNKGHLRALLDGAAITAIRTAAASAVATQALARTDARILGICGTGEQAYAHLRALAGIRRFERCLVWGRTETSAIRLVEAGRRLGLPIEIAPDPRLLAQTADVICTTTAATDAYLHGEWIQRGAHLNLVGSSVPTTSEVDSQTLTRGRLFVDFRDSALALGGEIRRAIDEGAVSSDPIEGEIGEVLLGQLHGRRSADEITIFKSLGMISEDLLVAHRVLEAAEAEGAGLLTDFDGVAANPNDPKTDFL